MCVTERVCVWGSHKPWHRKRRGRGEKGEVFTLSYLIEKHLWNRSEWCLLGHLSSSLWVNVQIDIYIGNSLLLQESLCGSNNHGDDQESDESSQFCAWNLSPKMCGFFQKNEAYLQWGHPEMLYTVTRPLYECRWLARSSSSGLAPTVCGWKHFSNIHGEGLDGPQQEMHDL